MAFLDFIQNLFETDGFPARWKCGTGWTDGLGWLHIVSDWAIFGAYAAIPVVLTLFLRRRRDIPFPVTGWLFVAFILSCGITHLVDSTMFYYPAYRFLGVMKVLTATVSLATVASLIRIMPAVLAVPGIKKQNIELRSDLDDREREARSLERVRDQLDTKAADLTTQLTHARGAMAAAAVFAVEWEPGSDKVFWQIGTEALFPHLGTAPLTDWTQLLGERGTRALHEACRAMRGDDAVLDIVLTVETDPLKRSFRIVGTHKGASAAGRPMLSGMARVMHGPS